MMIVDDIPGAVGKAERGGRVSAVESGTISEGNFDETVEHEIGHNLTLEHSESGLMVGNGTFGNKKVTKKEKGELVSGQLNPNDGNGVYKDSKTNATGRYKKPIKKQANDFLKRNKIE